MSGFCTGESLERSMEGTKVGRSLDFPLQWGSRKRQRGPKVANGRKEAVVAFKKAMRAGDSCVVNGKKQDSRPVADATVPCPPDSKKRFFDLAGELLAVRKADDVGVYPQKCHGVQLSENPPNSSHSRRSEGEGLQDLPKFLIGLSRKEKEEDFLAIKGSRLPPRPKKRARHIQRILHGISPGTWLCRLSLDGYKVCERGKSRKQHSQGLKAMCNVDSDSEGT